jgi:TetR/AcrR family transcriptional regulator, regulator of cefoperazone and chloramphenicol sensitivity
MRGVSARLKPVVSARLKPRAAKASVPAHLEPSAGKAVGDPDLETRDRLLESAASLFAANGFAKVTVRDICHAARANVAAVNYHFGGKTGLYEQVLRLAIAVMQETTTEAMQAGDGRHPREQLTAYISVFLRRVFEGRDSWIHQMMMRELADPTPALDLVVDEVIRPRMAYLTKVIATLVRKPAGDERVGRCVASVNAQCLAVLRNEVSDRLGFEITAGTIDDMAHHIARFSLAGIRAIASE